MKDWIISRAEGLVIPLVLGPLSFLITQWLKRSISAIDEANPQVKQAIVVVLSFAMAGIVRFAGPYLPAICDTGPDAMGCLSAIADPQAMQVMLSALFAYALHASRKKQEV
jgi:hypothetical protein